jgi:hypothetical protein
MPLALIECQPNVFAPLLPAAGAVLFGAMPHLICARRSRLTYGVGTSRPYCSGDPPQSKFWHKEKCCFYTRDCFSQYLSINQLVSSVGAALLAGSAACRLCRRAAARVSSSAAGDCIQPLCHSPSADGDDRCPCGS